MDWIHVVTALLTAMLTGGSLAAYFEYRAKKLAIVTQADKDVLDADIHKLEAKLKLRQFDIDSWEKLINLQTLRIDHLYERVAKLEALVAARDIRIDELEHEIDELRKWIQEQGLQPPPRRRNRNP
jgi:septal ring factor EnvC (AmiA/AmiB activator)